MDSLDEDFDALFEAPDASATGVDPINDTMYSGTCCQYVLVCAVPLHRCIYCVVVCVCCWGWVRALASGRPGGRTQCQLRRELGILVGQPLGSSTPKSNDGQ